MKRTPLAALHEARGACWMEYHGWEIPSFFSRVEDEYQALQEGCALIDLSYRGKMRITGRDRRTWLHGQVTQDIKNLPDGRAAYATVLTPQGKMVSDLRVLAVEDELILDVPAGTATPMPEYLDHYLIMERAEIEDLTDAYALISIQGPHAPSAVAAVLGDEPTRLPLWGTMRHEFQDDCLYVARIPECGEDGFNLFVSARCAPALWGALCQHRTALAVHSAGWEALNVRRLEAGIPWWGEELNSTLVPLEARLEHAISLQKGCYVGQEIIARIDARGHVNNLLAGFFVHGDALPARGTEIHHNGKRVGVVSTVVQSLRLHRPVALGYLRRELQEPGARFLVGTPQGEVELEVTTLPFVPHDFPAIEN
jgi:folate-binding protein YgfZ